MKLKDTEKMYFLTDMCIRVFNRLGRLLLYEEVKEMHHYSEKRDWVINLHNGGEIWIDSGVIEKIVEHENSEAGL